MMLRVLLLATALATTPAFADDLGGRATVVDGDTIEVHGQRIRLHGIDAAETSQPCFDENGASWRCGQAAAMALADFIGQSPVSCIALTTDRYGRTVARCTVRGEDIERFMVENGYAWSYRRFSTEYIGAEQAAKNKHIGIWRGATVPPWEWRHRSTGGQ